MELEDHTMRIRDHDDTDPRPCDRVIADKYVRYVTPCLTLSSQPCATLKERKKESKRRPFSDQPNSIFSKAKDRTLLTLVPCDCFGWWCRLSGDVGAERGTL